MMIEEVSYTNILKIRQEVMYPDKGQEYVILPDDENGIHMGYYLNGTPISIISLFLENRELQFRKFATLPEFQGKGYGSSLLKWVLDYAKDMQFNKVWCNARYDKISFYKKFGLDQTENIFERDGLKYIILEKLRENSSQ